MDDLYIVSVFYVRLAERSPESKGFWRSAYWAGLRRNQIIIAKHIIVQMLNDVTAHAEILALTAQSRIMVLNIWSIVPYMSP